MEVPGDTPIFPLKIVVNAPLKAISVPANTEKSLHLPSTTTSDEELDGVIDAETDDDDELEGDTFRVDCVADGVDDPMGRLVDE